MVGAAVGSEVGALVGALVGAAVGSGVGPGVGAAVGAAVGAEVGVAVGTGVGAAVGALVGAAVGIGDGTRVGVADGVADGTGSEIGMTVIRTLEGLSSEGLAVGGMSLHPVVGTGVGFLDGLFTGLHVGLYRMTSGDSMIFDSTTTVAVIDVHITARRKGKTMSFIVQDV